jgi:hypothetical protein
VSDFDGIVVGGWHNGLTCAACLTQAPPLATELRASHQTPSRHAPLGRPCNKGRHLDDHRYMERKDNAN